MLAGDMDCLVGIDGRDNVEARTGSGDDAGSGLEHDIEDIHAAARATYEDDSAPETSTEETSMVAGTSGVVSSHSSMPSLAFLWH